MILLISKQSLYVLFMKVSQTSKDFVSESEFD